ncbi:restriction endonuclease subunit S [Kineosphaera limosa]|uniref:restriction endonuclease subunit S n=1 Tax=Kineosphaera limosa TaxID=111564 RepID=UPI0012F8F32C|nr:restriction endonuclease subunit S [Kineosphaera limosa]
MLTFAVGGGWGDEEASAETTPCLVVRGTDLMSVRGGSLDSVPLRYETPKKMASRALQEGDIILEISGGSKGQPTGRTALVTQQLLDRSKHPVIPASFCRLLRPDRSQVHPRYLYYWLQEMYSSGRVWSYQNQSTGIANFQMKVFTQVEMVRLPPLEEQERIAGVLGAFDDLIETNRRLAQAAIGLQRAAFLRATEGLPRVPISEVMQVEMGQSPPGDTYNFDGDGLPFFQGVKDFSDRYPATRVYCSQPRRIAEPGDLLLAVRAPIGRVNVATERCATGRGLAILRSGLPAIALQSLTAKADLWAAYEDEGTVFSSINRKVISDQRIRWTSDPDLARALEALDELVLDCHEKNSALTRQRDELLPLLMSGKVRVRDVEAGAS